MMEDVVEKFVKYFKSILHHNNWYFAYFVGCKYCRTIVIAFVDGQNPR